MRPGRLYAVQQVISRFGQSASVHVSKAEVIRVLDDHYTVDLACFVAGYLAYVVGWRWVSTCMCWGVAPSHARCTKSAFGTPLQHSTATLTYPLPGAHEY
jgi:hypothetical protein